MTPLAGRGIAAVLALLAATGTLAAAQPTGLDAPAYREGDRWAYSVQGALPGLPGFENGSASLAIQGNATLRAVAVTDEDATLRWDADLRLTGSLAFVEQEPLQATLSGSVEVEREERYDRRYFLPVELRSTSAFAGQIAAFGGFELGYAATLEEDLLLAPGASFPAYPLEEGVHMVNASMRRWANLTLSVAGGENATATFQETESLLRIEVTGGHAVQVPAGDYVATRTATEALQGVAPGLLQALIPGATEVAYFAASEAVPVLLAYTVGEEVVGEVALRASGAPSDVPPWLLATLVGVALAVPAAVLLYRAWRERRRGL